MTSPPNHRPGGKWQYIAGNGAPPKQYVIARSEATRQSPVGFMEYSGGDCHVGGKAPSSQ